MLKDQRANVFYKLDTTNINKGKFLQYCLFCFYYLKHADIFKEPTYVPKKEESIFNQNVL